MDMGKAMMYPQVRRLTIIASPTSQGGGPPDRVGRAAGEFRLKGNGLEILCGITKGVVDDDGVSCRRYISER